MDGTSIHHAPHARYAGMEEGYIPREEVDSFFVAVGGTGLLTPDWTMRLSQAVIVRKNATKLRLKNRMGR